MKEFERLIQPLKRFRATGSTFRHKEEITSWGWHWNQDKRCWETEAEGADDICVRAVADLKGVQVKEVREESVRG